MLSDVTLAEHVAQVSQLSRRIAAALELRPLVCAGMVSIYDDLLLEEAVKFILSARPANLNFLLAGPTRLSTIPGSSRATVTSSYSRHGSQRHVRV